MKKLFQPRSVFVTWAISYAVLLIIYVFIIFVIYINSSKLLEAEVYKNNQMILTDLQKNLDSLVEKSITYMDHLSLNTTITQNMLNRPSDYYKIYDISNRIASYNVLQEPISDIFVYIKNEDLVISRNSVLAASRYFEIYVKEKNAISYDEWKNMITKNYQGVEYACNQNSIYICRTLPLVFANNSLATVIVELDALKCLQQASSSEYTGVITDLAIFDKNKNLAISLNNSEFIWQVQPNDFLDFEKLFVKSFENDKIVVSYVKSPITNFYYTISFPYGSFWEIVKQNQNIMIVGLLFFVSFGVLFSLFFLKNNYAPINEMVSLIKHKYKFHLDNKNEIIYIKDALSKLELEKNKMNTTLKNQNKEMRNLVITKLLKGYIQHQISIEELLETNSISFNSNKFSVCIFYIKDFEQMFMGEENVDNYEKFSLTMFVVSVVMEEIFEKHNCKGFVTIVDDLLVGIVNYNENNDKEFRNIVCEAAKEAYDFLLNNFGILIAIASSNVYSDINNIPQAYKIALKILEYKTVLAIDDLVLFEEILTERTEDIDFYYPLETESHLINFIKVGDFEKSNGIMEEIYVNNFENKNLPANIAKCLMIDLACTLVKAMYEIGIEIKGFDPVSKIINCSDIIEMKKELINFISILCNKQMEQRGRFKPRNEQIIKDIQKYVLENYKDPSLDVTFIAEKFNMHIVNVSKLFKEFTGDGLHDFINSTRIANSKKYLLNSLTLEETAFKVGFSNVRTFVRVFKKFEGVTPGKFKVFKQD